MPADDQPWTTSRCNRLLRPLSSRLATLRKELDQRRKVAAEARNVSATVTNRNATSTATFVKPSNPRKPRGFEKARDPDWMPGAKPAGVHKQTYGGRKGRKPSNTQEVAGDIGTIGRPGEIAFTPLIARTGGRFFETPQLHNSPLRRKKKGPLVAKVEQIKHLKKQMPPDIGKLIEGLLDGYAKLLQATHASEEKSRKGARSLVGTCLHKIPAYIELEEHFADMDRVEDNDDARDLCDEIYTHLEQTFGSQNGQGWRPFRQIVRAHGTSLLCDAFADEILGLDALPAVVDLCMKAAAWDEAEKFIWTFLPNVKPLSTPNNLQASLFHQEASIYTHIAHTLVDHTGRHGFFYDLLEHMVSQELLPLEWLATESMRPLWGRLVRALAEGDHRTLGHAFRFLETTICAGLGLPDDSVFEGNNIDLVSKQIKPSLRQELRDALDNTFSSLLTILPSIALVSQSQAENADEYTMQRITCILDSIAVGLLKRSDIRSDLELLDTTPENMQTFAQRALWTIAASLLVHLGGCSPSSDVISIDVSTLVQAFSWISYQYSCHDINISALLATLPTFISSTARCSGKAWHDDGFDQLQRLVNSLLSLSSSRLPHKLWNLKRVALETCLEFAHSTNNGEHIAYAREVERLMSSKGRVMLTHSPQKNDSPSAAGGFRWEEGIGEWVACTPFAKQEIKRVPRKPLPVLELLPSPEVSELSEISADDEDISEHDDFPQSSPVKAQRASTPSIRKRLRVPSPIVLIPVKRTRLTPPDSASSSFSSDAQPGPRRSRRTKEQITAVANSLRNRRSRSSLDSTLRRIAPKKYVELVERSENESESASEDEDIQDSEELEDDELDQAEDGNEPGQAEDENEDDGDELGRTPAAMRMKRNYKPSRVTAVKIGEGIPAKRSRGRPKKQWALVGLDQGEESEDELSFQ